MGKEILQKYTIFEVKRQLAEIEKQYGKERVAEMLGEGRAAEIDREFKKAVAERLEPTGKTFRRTSTEASGHAFAFNLNTRSATAAPNVTCRNTSCKLSWTICSLTSALSLNPKKASASLKNGKTVENVVERQ